MTRLTGMMGHVLYPAGRDLVVWPVGFLFADLAMPTVYSIFGLALAAYLSLVVLGSGLLYMYQVLRYLTGHRPLPDGWVEVKD